MMDARLFCRWVPCLMINSEEPPWRVGLWLRLQSRETCKDLYELCKG